MHDKMMCSNRAGFTLGFDGKSCFAPVSVENFYNVDVESVVIRCRGDVADLMTKYPDRIQFKSDGNRFALGDVKRDAVDGTVMITVRTNSK